MHPISLRPRRRLPAMLDLIINSSITHSLMLVVPVVLALGLRAVRCPGWPVVGGLLAGMLLSPALLGRHAPETYEQHFVGGVAEQRAVLDHQRQTRLDLEVMRHEGADATARNAHRRQALARELDLVRLRDDARWSFQRPFRSYTTAFIVLTLLAGGLLSAPRDPHAPDEPRPGPVAPLLLGTWCAAIPGGLAALYLHAAGAAPSAILFGASAVAIGPWIMSTADRDAADRAERGGAALVHHAGIIATLCALVALTVAAWQVRGIEGALWALALLAAPVAAVLPRLDADAPARRHVERLTQYALLPVLTACVAMRLEFALHLTASLVPLIIFALLSADGRWFGGIASLTTLGGRRGTRTMRLLVGSIACGPTQLAVLAVALELHAISEPIAIGILGGAVLLEVAAPLRASLAESILRAEREIDTFKDLD